MIEQVHVEIAIAVIVEEKRLGRVTFVLESVLPGAIAEGAIAVIDVQHVASVHGEVVNAADVDVDVTIAIDVGHRHAGFPPC